MSGQNDSMPPGGANGDPDDVPMPGQDMPTQAPPAAAPRRRRWVIWVLSGVLLVSMALNLAVVGFVVRRIGGPPGGIGDSMRAVAKQMDAADRKALRTAFWSQRGELRAVRRDHFEAIRAVREALEAEPFDPARLNRAMDGLRREIGHGAEVFQAIIVEAAGNMSHDARMKLARMRPGGGAFERPEHRPPGEHDGALQERAAPPWPRPPAGSADRPRLPPPPGAIPGDNWAPPTERPE